jgi:polysaccharide export outer membrane protein
MRNGKPYRKEIDVAAVFLNNQLQDDAVVVPGDVIYVHRQPVYYIYGEVQRPGSYRVERSMTIQQALAQGGGPTVRGTERWLRLHRRSTDGKVQVLRPSPQDPILADDILYVRESLF